MHTKAKYKVNPISMTVKLKKNIPIDALEDLNRSKKIIIKNINKLGYIDVELTKENNFYDFYYYYKQSNLFDVIEINSFGKPTSIPNDLHPAQYYLTHITRPNINVLGAWDIVTGSNSIIIAVIDDGVA